MLSPLLPAPHRFAFVLAATALLSLTGLAKAQETSVNPDPQPSLLPPDPGPPTVQTDYTDPPLPAPANEPVVEQPTANTVSSTPRRFQYGLRLAVHEVYDDNVNLTARNQISDSYTSIELGINLGLGDYASRQTNFVAFDYSPRLGIFADNSQFNSIQHVVRLEGQYVMSRLTLGLSEDIQLLDGNDVNLSTGTGATVNRVNLDVGSRTRVNIYTTHLTANYDLTGKTSISAGLTTSITNYSSLISSSVFSGDVYLNYAYDPKITVGVGVSGGYEVVDRPSPDQLFEQLNMRLSYQLTGKVSLNASAGVESRQFQGAGTAGAAGGSNLSPVFDIGAAYEPFDGTSLTFNASRRTVNSAALAGQDYASTSVTVTARQRLFQRFSLGIAVGYENSSYFSTLSSVTSNREDNYYFVQPSLDFPITRFWTVGVFYLHRENRSSTLNSGFYDNQFGFRTSLTF